jgi:oxygen-independent coproporphyrinogen-3 oxidase
MVDSICREMELKAQQNLFSEHEIETIYLGGGTPSLLSPEELNQIFDKIHLLFSVTSKAEITIETNPDDIHRNTIVEWKKTGINRLSIGIQSFFEEELKWMNRAHNAKQAFDCIPLAQDLGFENITADLIFGSPVQTLEMHEVNLRTMIDMGIPHISCYAMTVEPQTALHHKIKTGQSKDVDADRQAAFFSVSWINSKMLDLIIMRSAIMPNLDLRAITTAIIGKGFLISGSDPLRILLMEKEPEVGMPQTTSCI